MNSQKSLRHFAPPTQVVRLDEIGWSPKVKSVVSPFELLSFCSWPSTRATLRLTHVGSTLRTFSAINLTVS